MKEEEHMNTADPGKINEHSRSRRTHEHSRSRRTHEHSRSITTNKLNNFLTSKNPLNNRSIKQRRRMRRTRTLMCLHAPAATDLVRSVLECSGRHRSGLVVVAVASRTRRGDGGAADLNLEKEGRWRPGSDLARSVLACSGRHRSGLVMVAVASRTMRGDGGAANLNLEKEGR